jgi:hypothetical protein
MPPLPPPTPPAPEAGGAPPLLPPTGVFPPAPPAPAAVAGHMHGSYIRDDALQAAVRGCPFGHTMSLHIMLVPGMHMPGGVTPGFPTLPAPPPGFGSVEPHAATSQTSAAKPQFRKAQTMDPTSQRASPTRYIRYTVSLARANTNVAATGHSGARGLRWMSAAA